MAKVRGPLFSLAASGTVAHALTYRSNDGYCVATRPPIPTGAPSTWQLAERQTMRDAAAGWASLSANDRAIWSANELPTVRSGWMSFFFEWKTQRVAAGQVPLIPAQYIGTPTRAPFPDPIVPTDHGPHAYHPAHHLATAAPVTPPARTVPAAHFGARDWQHGIYFEHARGPLRAHLALTGHPSTTPPSHARGALRPHGSRGRPRRN